MPKVQVEELNRGFSKVKIDLDNYKRKFKKNNRDEKLEKEIKNSYVYIYYLDWKAIHETEKLEFKKKLSKEVKQYVKQIGEKLLLRWKARIEEREREYVKERLESKIEIKEVNWEKINKSIGIEEESQEGFFQWVNKKEDKGVKRINAQKVKVEVKNPVKKFKKEEE